MGVKYQSKTLLEGPLINGLSILLGMSDMFNVHAHSKILFHLIKDQSIQHIFIANKLNSSVAKSCGKFSTYLSLNGSTFTLSLVLMK